MPESEDAASPAAEPATAGRSEFPKGGYAVTRTAHVSTIAGKSMVKVARFGRHEVYSDEPESVGGDDEHLSPLGYLASGIGF